MQQGYIAPKEKLSNSGDKVWANWRSNVTAMVASLHPRIRPMDSNFPSTEQWVCRARTEAYAPNLTSNPDISRQSHVTGSKRVSANHLPHGFSALAWCEIQMHDLRENVVVRFPLQVHFMIEQSCINQFILMSFIWLFFWLQTSRDLSRVQLREITEILRSHTKSSLFLSLLEQSFGGLDASVSLLACLPACLSAYPFVGIYVNVLLSKSNALLTAFFFS